MGCFVDPSTDDVVFGCPWGLGDLYTLDVSGNSTSAGAEECPSSLKGTKFHIMEDETTVLAVGHSKNVYSVDHDGDPTIFTKLTKGSQVLAAAHDLSMSLLSPRKTAACQA